LKRNKAQSLLLSPVYDQDLELGKQTSLLLKEAAGIFDYIFLNFKDFKTKGVIPSRECFRLTDP
jgi:hypothetical protein